MGELEQAILEEDISKILGLIKEGQYSTDEILLGICLLSESPELLKDILGLADGNGVDENG